MELSKEQLLQIDNYIFVCGIKYYDVRTEIVDHFANILELKLDKNPNLNFKKEIENIHRNFSDRGFSKLLKQKTTSVIKQFYKQYFKHLITFFKLPKIIITGFLFFVLVQIMNVFEDKNNFFLILLGIGIIMTCFIIGKTFWKDSTKEKFLTLDMSISFFQGFHFVVVMLQSFNNRGVESLQNKLHNYLLLGGYVFLFLFFLSGEYVYHQNKKLVKKQYPNILV